MVVPFTGAEGNDGIQLQQGGPFPRWDENGRSIFHLYGSPDLKRHIRYYVGCIKNVPDHFSVS